jgi:hypothetical protein
MQAQLLASHGLDFFLVFSIRLLHLGELSSSTALPLLDCPASSALVIQYRLIFSDGCNSSSFH